MNTPTLQDIDDLQSEIVWQMQHGHEDGTCYARIQGRIAMLAAKLREAMAARTADGCN